MLNPSIKKATAFAPATCANVIVGFDILGFASDFIGDTVTLELREDKKIVIDSIDSEDSLPFDSDKNTAAVAVKAMVGGLQLNIGFTLHIKKGIPVSSGLGGSAASAVAAVVACNAFLKIPLTHKELLPFILAGEAISSGAAHADNIVPCLYGGLTLVRSIDPFDIIALPIPDVFCVFIHPSLQVNTKEARSLLKSTIFLADYVKQTRQLAGFFSALYEKNNRLLQQSLTDIIVEPQRAHYVPHFYALQKIALNHHALGMSFSGSGPTLFAWTEKKEEAEIIGTSIVKELEHHEIKAKYWVSRISVDGARIF